MQKINNMAVADRPRERLLYNGARALNDKELLAIILGRGSRKNDVLTLSRKIIKIIDEKGVDFSANDIMDVDGIGEAKAAAIKAAFEFVRRRIRPEGIRIRYPEDVLPLVRHYSDRMQEHFLCISINGANEVMKVRVVTIGLVNRSQVHPREVFADVLKDRAASIIIAHNHPSGNLKPSDEDIRITGQLKEAADLLGINLLDHIIFSTRGFYSFADNGEI